MQNYNIDKTSYVPLFKMRFSQNWTSAEVSFQEFSPFCYPFSRNFPFWWNVTYLHFTTLPASQVEILNKYIISYHRWPEFHQCHPEEDGIHWGQCRSKLDTSVLQDHLSETDPVNGQAHGQEQ